MPKKLTSSQWKELTIFAIGSFVSIASIGYYLLNYPPPSWIPNYNVFETSSPTKSSQDPGNGIEPAYAIPAKGTSGFLFTEDPSKQIAIATTSDAMVEMITAAANKDHNAANALVMNGKVLLIASSTPVLITSSAPSKAGDICEYRILKGNHKNKQGVTLCQFFIKF